MPGDDWFVDPSARVRGSGTATSPFRTLTEAVEASGQGDTLHLAPGTYPENLVLGHGLRIVGTGGDEATIVDGQGLAAVVAVSTPEAVTLEGLTLRNGLHGVHQTVETRAPIVVEGCTLLSNTETGFRGYVLDMRRSRVEANGRGIVGEGAPGWLGVSDSEVVGNASVGIAASGFLVVDSSLLAENGGSAVTAYGFWSTWIRNSLVRDNSAVLGGGLRITDSSTWVLGTTIAANSASKGGGIYVQGHAELSLVDSVLWNDGGGELVAVATPYVFGGSPTVDVRFSNVAGGWPGPGNIDADPLFRDPSAGDFGLEASSPCIDAGSVPAYLLAHFVPGAWQDPQDWKRIPLDLSRLQDVSAVPDTGVAFRALPVIDMGFQEVEAPGSGPVGLAR